MTLAATLALVLAGLATQARAATTFFIRGGGDGHGIGMSQYGAYGYALHGKDYRFILAHYYQGTKLAKTDPRRIVRVLLATGPASFSGATRAGTKRLEPSMTYTVGLNGDGSLSLVKQGGKRVGRFSAPLTVTGPGPLTLAGVGQYRGALEFRPDGVGGVQTVDAIGLDDYVRGVISAEVPASWSAEALKAQAVAARTYAITTNAGGGAFDLYPDTRSQMYRGVAAETPSTDAAVSATRAQVVIYNGAPVVTYFFNSSGGHTENIENVWPGAKPEPWLRGVPDPYDTAGGDPYHSWAYELSVQDAATKLGGWLRGSLVGIQVRKHGSSPRILTADVVGSRGRTTATGIQLQHAFGLLTTNVAFTTITTLPGGSSDAVTNTATKVGDAAQASAVIALLPLVHQMVAGAIPRLHGTVFAARRGAALAVQKATRSGWKTVAHASVATHGNYEAELPGPGKYRIVYRGLDGPPVPVTG